jgi:hypothetical protein
MESRYLLVRGVPGQLVANPHAPSHTRRCLGKKPNGTFWHAGPIDPDSGQPLWPAAVPVDEIVKEDGEGYLRKMIRKGCITLVAECKASSPDEAEKKLKPPAKSARSEK